jgi:hypothetical protein
MARPWTVLPHGPLEWLEENLIVVDSALPRGRIRRRMSVVRLSDRRLVFHNAVPLGMPAMGELEAFGRPAFLVVPNRFHRLDIHAWKARFPACAVLCPRPAAKAVGAVVAVDGALDALPRDPALAVETLSGSKTEEAVLVARSPDGARASLLFGDAVMNLPHLPGLEGFLLRLIGSTGGPRVTGLTRLVAVADRRALAAHLERLAATLGLLRLVPSHGAIVSARAGEVLREVAARLR